MSVLLSFSPLINIREASAVGGQDMRVWASVASDLAPTCHFEKLDLVLILKPLDNCLHDHFGPILGIGWHWGIGNSKLWLGY